MEHQFRRGIFRPNAQRLSISLAPLVAQRSLMFRVKTDLATKANYAELTPTEELPALYSLSQSAQLVSAVLTAISAVISAAMSSASAYSQDSWKGESPFVPRGMAIAFSPSGQEVDHDKEFTVKTPSVSHPVEDSDSEAHSQPDPIPSLAIDVVHESLEVSGVGSPTWTLVEKRYTMMEQQTPKRSRSSKAFRKVMAHLSFQPSKRQLAQLRRADIVASMDFKLSEFQASPILITQINTSPSVPCITGTPSAIAPFDSLAEEEDVGVRKLRVTIHPPVASPKRKSRGRFRSSLAVPYFRR